MPPRANAVLHAFADRLAALPSEDELKDPKTRLQELLQAQQLPPPEYLLTGTTGAEHARHFEASCRIDAMDLTTHGHGTSRRRAEQGAAQAALERLSREQ